MDIYILCMLSQLIYVDLENEVSTGLGSCLLGHTSTERIVRR